MIVMVNVRDAVMADASAIDGLLRLLGHGQSRESIETEIALGGSATGGVVVATDADTLVGFAAFAIWRAFVEQMSVCRLSAIAVRPDSRGLGVGGLLIREAERQAQAAGCAVVELSCGRRPERAQRMRSTSRSDSTTPAVTTRCSESRWARTVAWSTTDPELRRRRTTRCDTVQHGDRPPTLVQAVPRQGTNHRPAGPALSSGGHREAA